jgi:hypothetical protein
MIMKKSFTVIIGATVLLSAACNTGSSDVKPTAETKSATTPEAKPTNAAAPNVPTKIDEKTAAPGTTVQAATGSVNAVNTPQQQTYPLDAIKAVADDCVAPQVLLASAPKSVGSDYAWHVTRQAMLANQQFRVVPDPPTAPGEVQITPHSYADGGFALVARCSSGATCNRLAAMYKAIVRSSKPQIVCGSPIPGISANPVGTFRWDADAKANLPQDGELPALCARLSACTIASDQSTAGDPFLECQKAPSKFKTDCAKRYPCAEVIACTSK